MRLSLVIPCYNEAASLQELGERCVAALEAEPALEILLVDNGSTDNSPALIASVVSRHSRLSSLQLSPNRGYGHGILQGLAACTGDVLGWTHADLQTDPMDAVVGFRLLAQSPDWKRTYVKGLRRHRPLADKIFTIGMSMFETLLLGVLLVDINAQPNLFPRTLYRGWSNPPGDFSLDLFAYHSAKSAGLKVRRFAVDFGLRKHGQSHWNVDWRSKVKFIRRTLRFSLNLRRSLALDKNH